MTAHPRTNMRNVKACGSKAGALNALLFSIPAEAIGMNAEFQQMTVSRTLDFRFTTFLIFTT